MDLANEELMFPKYMRPEKLKKGLKKNSPLKTKTKLKAHYEPIPKKLKEEVLKAKGNKCFLGFCFNCGGQAEVGINDDFHHFIHKSQGSKDEIDYLWPCRRECHEACHDNPRLEKAMFNEIEKAGYKVEWKAKTKGIGAA